MKNDLISIIVPVYNVEKYLKRCIESITNQTYKNIEIILVDDGSTDNSSKICDEYKNKDKRIKVIHKTNGGISSARNRGLDIAKGDYIGFVDSDDYISPNMYEILYKELINNKVDISSCDSIIFKDNDIQFKKIESYKKYIMNKLEAIETLIRNNNNVNPSAWNKLYKKKLFKNVRYPEGYVYEDILTTYLVIEKSNKLIHIKYPLYAYNNRSESIIHNKKNKIKTIYDQLEMIEQRSNLIINKYPKLRKNVINNYVLHILYLYIDFYNIKNIILDDKIKHRFNYIKTIDTKLIDKKIIGKRNYIFFKTYRINKYLLILICHIYKYYKVIKRSFILKQSKKRQYINCRKISSFRLFLRKFKHFGLKYKCNMCHSLLRYMFPYGIDSPIFKEKNIIGGGYRKDVYCPVCNCTDRDRFLYFYIKKYTNILTSKVNILHFAPETEILEHIIKNKKANYVDADIDPKKSNNIIDITNIPFNDNFFDYIIVNHVLEHIRDEKKTINELKRVLKSDGQIILTVPICLTDEITLEDKNYSPKERLEKFGQEDHVRLYGRDFKKRIENYGVKVEEYSLKKEKKQNRLKKYRFLENGIIFIIKKI